MDTWEFLAAETQDEGVVTEVIRPAAVIPEVAATNQRSVASGAVSQKTLPPSLPPKDGFPEISVDVDGLKLRSSATDRSAVEGQETCLKSGVLTRGEGSARLSNSTWRGGRVVECAGFENRSARKGSGSSNLPLSVSPEPPAVTTAGGVISEIIV